jgi:hypothetical protein
VRRGADAGAGAGADAGAAPRWTQELDASSHAHLLDLHAGAATPVERWLPLLREWEKLAPLDARGRGAPPRGAQPGQLAHVLLCMLDRYLELCAAPEWQQGSAPTADAAWASARGDAGEFLFTVTCYANHAHTLTRSP